MLEKNNGNHDIVPPYENAYEIIHPVNRSAHACKLLAIYL